jgi:hypothetical protein
VNHKYKHWTRVKFWSLADLKCALFEYFSQLNIWLNIKKISLYLGKYLKKSTTNESSKKKAHIISKDYAKYNYLTKRYFINKRLWEKFEKLFVDMGRTKNFFTVLTVCRVTKRQLILLSSSTPIRKDILKTYKLLKLVRLTSLVSVVKSCGLPEDNYLKI